MRQSMYPRRRQSHHNSSHVMPRLPIWHKLYEPRMEMCKGPCYQYSAKSCFIYSRAQTSETTKIWSSKTERRFIGLSYWPCCCLEAIISNWSTYGDLCGVYASRQNEWLFCEESKTFFGLLLIAVYPFTKKYVWAYVYQSTYYSNKHDTNNEDSEDIHRERIMRMHCESQ